MNKSLDSKSIQIILYIILVIVIAVCVALVPAIVDFVQGGDHKFEIGGQHEVTVIFEPNGGEVSEDSRQVLYEHKYGALPTPKRNGMDFLGWYTDNGTQITEKTEVLTLSTHTLYAKWGVNVSFDLNAGSNTKYDPQLVIWKERYGTLPIPQKAGATFLGWYTTKEFETEITSDTVVTEEKNHTLYAKWGVTLSFDTNGVGEVDSRQLVVGGKYGDLPELKKEGAEFLGWYTSKTGGTKVDSSAEVEKYFHHTLYARWGVMLSFDTNGGEELSINPYQVIYGFSYGELPTTKREGMTFAGWYNDSGKKITSASKVDNMNHHTIHAKWSVTVTFDLNDGSNTKYSSQPVICNEQYGTLSTPRKANATFLGWYTTPTYETKITSDTVVTAEKNHTLYAKWGVTLSFDTNGGEEQAIDPYQVVYGLQYGELPTLTKENVEFLGWYTEINGGDKVESSTNVTELANHTLYAKWGFTLCFDTNDGEEPSIEPYQVVCGLKYGNLPVPKKENDIFLGWFTTPTFEEEITSDEIVLMNASHTLYAKWISHHKTTIEYDLNDTIRGDVEKLKTIAGVSYNDVILGYARATTYVDYYSFDGWFTESVGGIQITDKTGALLSNISGYTNENGKWISEEQSITLYAHWSQAMTGTYIETAEEMMSIEGDGTYVIICDIDMVDKTWTPIDTFSGEIDGQSHCIYNLTYSYDGGDTTLINYGFCKVLEGVVRNITFESLSISIKTHKDGEPNMYIGAICGTLHGGTISDVTIKNSVITGYHYRDVDKRGSAVKVQLGGIAGLVSSGNIERCTVVGSILYGKSDMGKHDGDGHTNIGGIVGELVGSVMIADCSVTNCTITSTSRGTASNNVLGGDKAVLYVRAGGIAGFMGGDAVIDNCYTGSNTITVVQEKAGNDGLDSDSEKYSGAVVGKAISGTVQNCTTSQQTGGWYHGTLTNFTNNKYESSDTI